MKFPVEENAIESRRIVIDRLVDKIYPLLVIPSIDADTMDLLATLKNALREYLVVHLEEGCFISDKSHSLVHFLNEVVKCSFVKPFSLSWNKRSLKLYIEGRPVIIKMSDTIVGMEVGFLGRKDESNKS